MDMQVQDPVTGLCLHDPAERLVASPVELVAGWVRPAAG
jgi:hypothetical protein